MKRKGAARVDVLLRIFMRTIFMYLIILLTMRLMGKREIGKLSVFDLIVSFMIADISAIAIENTEEPLLYGLIPIITLAALQILFSFVSLKSVKMRRLFDGEPKMLIKNGQIQDKEMEKARYTLDDLLMQLREKNVPDVSDVEFAILETSGRLSVFLKEEKQPAQKEDVKKIDSLNRYSLPIPLIIEGKVQEEGLKKIGQNLFWLKNEVQKQGYKDFKEIYFASIDQDGNIYIDRKEN